MGTNAFGRVPHSFETNPSATLTINVISSRKSFEKESQISKIEKLVMTARSFSSRYQYLNDDILDSLSTVRHSSFVIENQSIHSETRNDFSHSGVMYAPKKLSQRTVNKDRMLCTVRSVQTVLYVLPPIIGVRSSIMRHEFCRALSSKSDTSYRFSRSRKKRKRTKRKKSKPFFILQSKRPRKKTKQGEKLTTQLLFGPC